MQKAILVCLHGFLGRPSDFDFLKSDFEVIALDYFKMNELNPTHDYEIWARNFSDWVYNDVKLKYSNREIHLVAYSLGGRLAAHAVKLNQNIFSQKFFLSVNPAHQMSSTDRSMRFESDHKWAQKFRSEPWIDVMKDWNDQGVFKSALPSESTAQNREPVRDEIDYDREALALALINWSLSRQQDLSDVLRESHVLVGEFDAKFCEVSEMARLDFKKVPGSSHRLLFQNPGFILNYLKNNLS